MTHQEHLFAVPISSYKLDDRGKGHLNVHIANTFAIQRSYSLPIKYIDSLPLSTQFTHLHQIDKCYCSEKCKYKREAM